MKGLLRNGRKRRAEEVVTMLPPHYERRKRPLCNRYGDG